MTLNELIGTEVPIVQAPMAGVQAGALAIAVSNAGGLGSLPSALLTPDELRRELQNIRAQTDRPFNVNFFCHTPPQPDEARERRWRNTLAPFYREFGVDAEAVPPAKVRSPFDAEAADIVAGFRPAVISFHFGLPEPELLDRARATGAKIFCSATTVDEALVLERRGVDVIVAQGLEAGGHRGMFLTDDVTTQVGTLALVPQIVRAVRVPVIAAGGIGDARGVAAALALGACGVQAGTAFLLCPEAMTSPLHRRALSSERARHTALTNVFTGRPARAIVNRAVREMGPMTPLAPAFPLASGALGPLRAAAEAQGRDDFSPLWAGQHAAACRSVPAREVMAALTGS